MLAFSALVAGSFSLGGLVANEISPVALNACRFWIAAAIIGSIVVWRGGVPGQALAAPWRYLFLGFCLATYFALMFEGLKTAPPVSAAAVFTLTPLLSAIFGWFLMRQVTSPRIAFALAIGAAGALWVIFRADLSALLAFDIGRGEAIYFVGCISHAFYTPLVRRLNRGESPIVFTLGTLVTGAIMLTAFGWCEIVQTDWLGLNPLVWIAILYTAVFASAASFVLLQFAALQLPASKVMAYTYLTPSWVMVWEAFIGTNAFSALALVGVLGTICALILLLRD